MPAECFGPKPSVDRQTLLITETGELAESGRKSCSLYKLGSGAFECLNVFSIFVEISSERAPVETLARLGLCAKEPLGKLLNRTNG